MARTVSIGRQDFEKMRTRNNFYIDKTNFIREWWEADDDVTLITRPRRFGKTLTMSMVEQFFSVEYANRGELFEGLSVWEDEKYRQLQGTYPVISLSFAKVKETSFLNTRKKICGVIKELYNQNDFLLESDCLNEDEKVLFQKVSADMEDYIASNSLNNLSHYLMRYYGKRVIILLDEYDTPMQEAYVGGYWEEMVQFIRNLFNATFKTNPYLERAIMTGITRVSKESIFSDLNNLEVVTTTSEAYADCFGFTEEEVFQALDEFGMSEEKGDVKKWYDGFCFGTKRDIYNPWSIINYLDKKKAGVYWANTSSNGLIGKLIREGNRNLKQDFQELLKGKSLITEIDEQIVYDQLGEDEAAIWSLLVASGYLKVVKQEDIFDDDYDMIASSYELALTNLEVRRMFRVMVRGWFSENRADYNDFIKALLLGDLDAMNHYMNRVALQTFSFFDTGKHPSGEEPERLHSVKAITKGLTEPNPSACFYHDFVLGLMVELTGRYTLTSNRESGFGRYDVMLEPKDRKDDAIILEFKVQSEKEKELTDTVSAALAQIEEKQYDADLIAKGFVREKIRKYGLAFCGKKVLIGGE